MIISCEYFLKKNQWIKKNRGETPEELFAGVLGKNPVEIVSKVPGGKTW